MTQPFIGEIRMFGGNFAPQGWVFCNGQLLNISEYDALFALVGTTYGGDGATTFALPDLRSRLAINQGQGTGLSARTIGQTGGAETVTLQMTEMPGHGHGLMATTAAGNLPGPASNAVPAKPTPTSGTASLYAVPTPTPINTIAMAQQAIGVAGQNIPHDNLMPSLCASFIISLFGIFPSRN